MAIYQTSKQITKFTISGIIAVAFDFCVYYGLSFLFQDAAASKETIFLSLNWNDVFKAFGFLSGTLITYNLNKFWTWRKADRNHKRLINFMVLYSMSFVLNIVINKLGMGIFKNHEFVGMFRNVDGSQYEFIALKIDKLFAFFLATAASSIFNFIGQKIWVFNTGDDGVVIDTDD